MTGGPGSGLEDFGDLLDNRFRTWEISGAVTQPLFNGGRIGANIRRSEALRKAAEANYRAVAMSCLHRSGNPDCKRVSEKGRRIT